MDSQVPKLRSFPQAPHLVRIVPSFAEMPFAHLDMPTSVCRATRRESSMIHFRPPCVRRALFTNAVRSFSYATNCMAQLTSAEDATRMPLLAPLPALQSGNFTPIYEHAHPWALLRSYTHRRGSEPWPPVGRPNPTSASSILYDEAGLGY